MSATIPRCLLAAVLLGAGPAFAEDFEARLLRQDGRPAAGFRILVVGRPGTVTTGPDGRFSLRPAPPVPFQLIAVGPGEEVASPIDVSSLPPGAVDLVVAPLAQDSVTVLSGIAPGLDLSPAAAASVVTAEALEQRPPQRLVDGLESVAGVSKLGDGADSVPVLRGLARGRTLVLVDGVRITTERRAGPSATFVAPAALAAVEVVRGPGSVLYGSDAFGGVINAVTREPEPGSAALRWTLDRWSGGWNEWSGSAWASTGAGEGAIGGEVHFADAADSRGGGGETIRNSSFRSHGAALSWASPWKRGQARASLALERVADLGKAAIDSATVRSYYPREDWDRMRLAWTGSATRDWDQLEGNLAYGRYRVRLHRDRAASPESPRRLDTSDTRADDASLRLVAGRPAAGGRLQLGLDLYSRLDLDVTVGNVLFVPGGTRPAADTSDAAITDARQITAGMFSTWSLPLAERWTLAVGGRGDRVESRTGGGSFGERSDTLSALSGNAAITWASDGGSVATAQWSRGFRVPTLSDRYYRGPSGRGFIIGNPDLEPERSVQWDVALSHRQGRWEASAFLYRYDITDLVERYREGDDYRFRNRGKAILEGTELELRSEVGARWRLDAGGSWSRSRAENGDPLDDAPAANAWLALRWSGERSYGFCRWSARAEKRDPGPSEVRRAGFGLLDLGWGSRFGDRLELRIAVTNALDRSYTASPDETADRAAGRTLTVGLTGRL
jgi:outer membrane receptor protein involved in Fe transport